GNTSNGVGVTFTTRLPEALVQVQSWPSTEGEVRKAVDGVTKAKLGKGIGSKAAQDGDRFAVYQTAGASIMPTGPGRWLIEGHGSDLEAQLRAAIPAELGAVTGLSHSRVILAVEGPSAEWLLATGIGLDFDARGFPVGTALQGHHHEIGLTIVRTDDTTFELYAFTSYARGLWYWLHTTAQEVGYAVKAAS
ncbi:MAG: sarcosine oxidase subunit gamma family protein, partial [Pseudomonadota bacterium]